MTTVRRQLANRSWFRWTGLLAGIVCSMCSHAADLAELTLEELLQVEVTTAGKKEQRLSTVAASVTVITAEDIRRSGATSLPEALRRVPGLFVGRINSGLYAVSARGSAERFSNKLLVLVDGRSIYTPLFSGVLWEQEDVMLENVERIEVVRGPGGTLWGANAVNGIINVITRQAADTQGGLVGVGMGTSERRLAARYGLAPADDVQVRVYGHGIGRDPGYSTTGSDDDWQHGRIGTRADWQPTGEDRLSLSSEFYESQIGKSFFSPNLTAPNFGSTQIDDGRYGGGYVKGNWQRAISEDCELNMQLYWDHSEIDSAITQYQQDTLDGELQLHWRGWQRHEIVSGLGYRGIWDSLEPTAILSGTPEDRDVHLFSGFVQDAISLIPETLVLTVGSKLEHNDYTGLETQPSVRLAWMPRGGTTLWAAWSRAVRTPSRAESDMTLNLAGTPTGMVHLRGNPNMGAEQLNSWEMGMRELLAERVSLEISVYYNAYDHLRTFENTGLAYVADNLMEGAAYGLETTLSWHPTDRLQWTLSYAYSRSEFRLSPGGKDYGGSESEEGEFPTHQVVLGAGWEPVNRVEIDALLRYHDNLPGQNLSGTMELDARIAWRSRENLELWLSGQNLLDTHESEVGAQGTVQVDSTEVRRRAMVGITWRF